MPVSQNTWYNDIKSGIFPKPIHDWPFGNGRFLENRENGTRPYETAGSQFAAVANRP